MKLKVERILWPTDFSELSLRAAPYARAYTELFGAELHVLHVHQVPFIDPPLSPAASRDLARYDAEMPGVARQELKKIAAALFEGNAKVVCEVLAGQPWFMICDHAQQTRIDLIILATHGRTGLRHVLIGSTAERVVQHAHCPVMTVKTVDKVS